MKTKTFIDEDDPTRTQQQIIFIEKLGEGFQANVFLVEFDNQRYALKLVSMGYMGMGNVGYLKGTRKGLAGDVRES